MGCGHHPWSPSTSENNPRHPTEGASEGVRLGEPAEGRNAAEGRSPVEAAGDVSPRPRGSVLSALAAGRFPKIVQETALVAGEGLEDRIRELMGDAYRAAEARRWAMEELAAAMAAKRAEQNRRAASASHAESARRGDRDEQETKTNAEDLQARRKEAEAIRVTNGGAPSQVRAASAGQRKISRTSEKILLSPVRKTLNTTLTKAVKTLSDEQVEAVRECLGRVAVAQPLLRQSAELPVGDAQRGDLLACHWSSAVVREAGKIHHLTDHVIGDRH